MAKDPSTESVTAPSADYLLKSSYASRIGKAVEHLVAASCILASRSELNVSTSLVDDEGVDLVFHRRGTSATIAAQVKSRGSDTTVVRRGRYTALVRSQTFRPRPDLYLLFVVIDAPSATIGPAWLVPSADFDRGALRTGRGILRFNASISPTSRDRWTQFRISGDRVAEQLAKKLLDLLPSRA